MNNADNKKKLEDVKVNYEEIIFDEAVNLEEVITPATGSAACCSS